MVSASSVRCQTQALKSNRFTSGAASDPSNVNVGKTGRRFANRAGAKATGDLLQAGEPVAAQQFMVVTLGG
jgi:hypothetical protein